MSKMRPAALAAVRKKLPAYTEPRWPAAGSLHTTLELLSGAELVGGSALDDLAVVLPPLVARGSKHKLPPPFAKAVKGAIAEPRLRTLRDLETACRSIVLMAEEGRSPVLAETFRVVEDLGERCLVWLAAIGCPQAAMHCAVLCMRYWRQRPTHSFVDVGTYGLMRSMLDYLLAADLDAVDDVEAYIPESRHVQIGIGVDQAARGLVHVLGIVQEAVELGAVELEDAFRKEMSDLDAWADQTAVAEDRAGVKRQPQAKSPLRVDPPADPDYDGQTYGSPGWLPPGVPSMRVVGDVSHLRKAGKHDTDPLRDAEAIIGKRLPLVVPPADLSVTRAELLAEAPHAAHVIDRILRPLATQETIRIPPIILVGPPGGGKTRLARRFGEVLDLQPAVYSMAGAMDAMTIAGTARGWSSAGFSAPVRDLIRTRIANPLLVIDEFDKMGTSRHNGNAADALINQIGAETAARYKDIYLQADVDLSRVQWILTANSLDTVPRALLDRCLVLRVPEPGPEHLRTLAASILDDVRTDRGLDERWAPPFDSVEWDALEEHWPGGSLRSLRRLVETVLDARDGGLRQ